jgi:predicted nucleotidyltransferase component of viral defense system
MKNPAASVHARLAQRRAKTGEDYNMLLVRFTLERLLYRLSRSSHREQFVLKGAMLFALWEPALRRVTRDLDLLGFGHPSPDRLADIFRELCRLEVEADGVDFDPRSVVCEDIRAQDE